MKTIWFTVWIDGNPMEPEFVLITDALKEIEWHINEYGAEDLRTIEIRRAAEERT